MNMVLADFRPRSRDQPTIVPFSVVQNINGTILALTGVYAAFRPFHLAEKWNGKWNAATEGVLTAALRFGRAILTIDAVQNTNGAIQGLILSDTTLRVRHLAEKVARAAVAWPFSLIPNINGPLLGLRPLGTTFRVAYLMAQVCRFVSAFPEFSNEVSRRRLDPDFAMKTVSGTGTPVKFKTRNSRPSAVLLTKYLCCDNLDTSGQKR